MDLSPQELDYMTRTVIGEAANQPPEGQAAVASVILNRLNSGQYGKTATDVVLAPNQFEPWNSRSGELLSIDPNSDQYQKARAIVSAVANGSVQDPTGGATYFLQPDIVKARTGTLPSWATGPSMRIGSHVFYYDGKGMAQNDTVTPDDIAATAGMLGLKVDGVQPATPTAPAASDADVSNSDIADTAHALGITLSNKSQLVPAPQAEITPQGRLRVYIGTRPPIQRPADMTEQVVQGMPVVAPAYDYALAATEAGFDPVVNAIRSLIGKQPNQIAPDFMDRLTQNLQGNRTANQQYAKENPITSTAANLAGGAMALGPLAATKVGGALLGTFGPSLASRIATGTIGGGAIGGLDALMRGENPVTGAELGGMGGAAGPIVGAGVQSAGTYALNNLIPKTGALSGLNSNAIAKLVAAFEGETPQSLSEAQTRMGPSGFVSDINPALTDIAGGIADIPGPGKATIRQAYQARASEQPQRIETALTNAMGPSRDIAQYKNMIAEERAAAADPLYEQFRSMQVHPTDELKALIPRLDKAGAFNFGEELSAISGHPIDKSFFTTSSQKTYPTTEGWDYVKRGLDRSIDRAYAANDKTLARELVKLKGEMIDEIGKTNAGKVWNQARSEFADRSALLDQIEAGRDTFLGGRSGLSADELKEELRTLKGPELSARIIGARSAADEAMGASVRGDTTLRNKLLAPNNRKKMELLLGKQKADALLQTMEQEKYLGDQHQNVVGGSQTTPKKERVNALSAPPMQPWDFDLAKPMSWLPPSVRDRLTLHGIVNDWRGASAQNTANQLAPLMVTPANAPNFQDLVTAIRNESARRGAAAARASQVGSALSGLISLPATTTARRQYLPAQ